MTWQDVILRCAVCAMMTGVVWAMAWAIVRVAQSWSKPQGGDKETR